MNIGGLHRDVSRLCGQAYGSDDQKRNELAGGTAE
jgi:hypothetical protein